MNLPLHTTKSKQKLKLNPKPFASGNEGCLHKVTSPKAWAGHVVKIYHPNKLSGNKEAKINYLIKHLPKELNEVSIVWITDAIMSERGDFLGFVMPFVKGEKLEILCTPNLPKKLSKKWYRFHSNADDVRDLRLKICYNLAAAIHKIHACGRYVLVDLKPDNIIISPEGLISLIDLDSVEIVENGYKLFDAPVATPEYTPPEHYRENESDPTQQQAWDCFSLGVIFYKLLMGIHPFAGTFKAPYDTATDLMQKIQQDLFVHNPNRSEYREVIPSLHQDFFKLSSHLQRLFYTCFVEGSIHPQLRPTAHEWCSAIMQHLDLHRLRILPSKLVEMPISIEDLNAVKEKGISPTSFLEKLELTKTIKDVSKTTSTQDNASPVINSLRRINIVIISLGLMAASSCALFENDLNTAVIILACCFLFFLAAIFFSFDDRRKSVHRLAFKFNLQDNQHFLEKQEAVFESLKKQVQQSFEQLTAQYKSLFKNSSGTKKESANPEFEAELEHLKEQLNQQDRLAQDLIDSEAFEYTTLKEKYNLLLHTHPAFAKAKSLDAESSTLAFSMQEEMERLQKTLGKTLKHTQSEYDELFNKDKREFDNQKRAVAHKLGKYKKYTAKAKKEEKRKFLHNMIRKTRKDLFSVAENADTRLTLFKEEILALLKEHNISYINKIKDIKAPGNITLMSGKVVSIAPLRYYQIHELLEWWLAAHAEQVEVPQDVLDEIALRHDEDFLLYKKEAKKELSKITAAATISKKRLQKKSLQVIKQLRERNEPEIIALKEKYKDRKKFLDKLFEERSIEEKEIHNRYESKFETLLKNIQEKVKRSNFYIRQIYELDSIEPNQIAAYQEQLKKYKLDLKQLEKEYLHLQECSNRYDIAKSKVNHLQKFSFTDHVLQMLFLKKMY